MSISHDTILRLIRKLPQYTITIDDSVKNIGIDDFAFKKRKKYCTLICAMDKRMILDILPSRNKEAVADWLKKYPQISLVSRDGSISYSSAITETLPNALQLSDNYHLVKNLLDNINRYVKRKYPKDLIISKSKQEIVDAVIEDEDNIKTAIRDEKIKAK
ncbi:transposase [Clostridium folliculivorans]|nr:transposase [Clostridium folliculivorans]